MEVTIASDGADGSQLSTDFTRTTVEQPPTNTEDPDVPVDEDDPVEVVTSNLLENGIGVILCSLIGALMLTPEEDKIWFSLHFWSSKSIHCISAIFTS